MPDETPPEPRTRTRTMPDMSTRQTVAAVAAAVALVLGGGAGGAFVAPAASDAAWRSSIEDRMGRMERRLDAVERGVGAIRCAVVLKGDVVGECQCRVPDLGLVAVCVQTPP